MAGVLLILLRSRGVAVLLVLVEVQMVSLGFGEATMHKEVKRPGFSSYLS